MEFLRNQNGYNLYPPYFSTFTFSLFFLYLSFIFSLLTDSYSFIYFLLFSCTSPSFIFFLFIYFFYSPICFIPSLGLFSSFSLYLLSIYFLHYFLYSPLFSYLLPTFPLF